VIEWLAGTTEEERRRLRLPYDPFGGYRLLSESTIRRFLNNTDDARLARALLDPPLADPAPPKAVAPEAAGETVRAVYALDGKTSRGARRPAHDRSRVPAVRQGIDQPSLLPKAVGDMFDAANVTCPARRVGTISTALSQTVMPGYQGDGSDCGLPRSSAGSGHAM